MKIIRTAEWKRKVFTLKRNKKISETLKRKYKNNEIKPHFKGKKLSKKHRNNISKGMFKGELSPCWKGENVGYVALHSWIRKIKPKSNLCEICLNDKKLELSNISGEYKRDIEDWWWVCRNCHRAYDINKFKEKTKIWKMKISKTLTGRRQNKETIEKRRKKLIGKKMSKETKRKISQANKIALKSYWRKKKQNANFI